MKEDNLIIALPEEIGNPHLFVGRKLELEFFLDWAMKTKPMLSQSMAILARRKKGKTALVQRFFNMLYTQNDPQIIPLYFKIEEGKVTQLDFSDQFYRVFLSQYYSLKLKDPDLLRRTADYPELKVLASGDAFILKDISAMEKTIKSRKPGLAWKHAREAGHRIAAKKNERIIQIIDEFQFLNEFIYTDDTYQTKIELASFYQSTAESKISPQIITGSYVGWLSAIIGHMTARYVSYELGNLTREDALAAVYNYANLLQLEVTDEVAAYIVEITEADPYYISRIIRSHYTGKDLTSISSVMETLKHESTYLRGEISRMWYEYIWSAFDRVNDKNAKKIVLYLAKHGDSERSREQILQDLKLDMTDEELEKKLHKLVKADIIAYGSSNFYFKGLGDKIFEIVFRNIYESELTHVGKEQVESEIMRQLASARGQISHYKGVTAEYRVINRFLVAGLKGKSLGEIVYNPKPGFTFGPFQSFEKDTIHLNQEQKIEIDIRGESVAQDGTDYIIEVKDWEAPVRHEQLRSFITKKQLLEGSFHKKTAFVFYSERGLSPEQQHLLDDNGIMYTDGGKLGG